MHRFHPCIAAVLVLLAGLCHPAAAADPSAGQQFFKQKIEPVLESRCYGCHSITAFQAQKLKGSLVLNLRAGMLQGGDSGPAVVPGKADESLLISALKHESFEMPPDGKLAEAVIGDFVKWINMGAPHPHDGELPARLLGKSPISEEDRNWWAYRPVSRPPVPDVNRREWVRNPIDAFILHRLEENGLEPNPPASKIVLLRRLYYNLIGLPPAPEEVDAFLADNSPDAYEKVVDRLLASPHYGEKWGRHWLDLVRYAETNGYERDNRKPNVWKYRDYVIRSFNADKPYDRFVIEQLAGDELPDATPETIIATGYYRLGLWDDEPVDRLQAYYDGLDDIVSTTGQVFLAMTTGCARCHEHKLDPFPQEDYYGLMAFFHNLHDGNTQAVVASEEAKQRRQRLVEANRQKLAALEKQIRDYEAKIMATFSNPEREDAKDKRVRGLLLKEKRKDALSPEELKDYLAVMKEHHDLKRKKLPPLESALAAAEKGTKAPPTHVLVRGNAHVKGKPVEPHFPQVLTPANYKVPEAKPTDRTAGRRLVLARWIASEENPVSARVMANRIWQHHFGRGIVETASDFGTAGTTPTHPALLDWLATEFMARGWKMKSLHKLILMSSAFQMSSAPNEVALEKDPTNKLFWRFDMRRLTAEELRDSMLAVTGKLNLKMYGPSIYPPLPEAVLATASRPNAAWGNSPPEEASRRSVYIEVKRSLRPPMLVNFDAPDPDSTTAVRFTTTVPTQALGMLNGKFTNEQAKLFVQRLKKDAPQSVADKVRLAIRLTTSRLPREDEVAADVKFIQAMQTEENLNDQQALESYCLLMLNTNEFVYLD